MFSPDDLELVKGGPAERRRYLDDALVASHPRYDALRTEVDKVLKQRNALLKGAAAASTTSAAFTLDVWDAKLVESGGALADGPPRTCSTASLPVLGGDLRRRGPRPGRRRGRATSAEWAATGLAEALAAARRDDVRRGVSTVGPHRDDVDAPASAGMPARTHASQGEQRSLALALRLAAHHVITDVTGSAPILLLDDVFSELDPDRSDALLANLPAGPDPPDERERPAPEGQPRARAARRRRPHHPERVGSGADGRSDRCPVTARAPAASGRRSTG